jgi:hypothetical protein
MKHSTLIIITLHTHLVYSISCDANSWTADQDIAHSFMESTVYYKGHEIVTQSSPEA